MNKRKRSPEREAAFFGSFGHLGLESWEVLSILFMSHMQEVQEGYCSHLRYFLNYFKSQRLKVCHSEAEWPKNLYERISFK